MIYRYLTLFFLVLSVAAWAGEIMVGPDDKACLTTTHPTPLTEKEKKAQQQLRMQQMDEMANHLISFQANFERALYYLVSFHGDVQKFQIVETDLHKSTLYTKARLDFMEAKRYMAQAEMHLQSAAFSGVLNESHCQGVKGKLDLAQAKWVVIKKTLRLIEYDLMNGSFGYAQQLLSTLGKDIESLMVDISEVASLGKSCVASGAL